MRIKRSVARLFGALIIPAISLVVTGYFGAYAIWGERGYLALRNTDAQLSARSAELADARSAREQLQRRVELMAPDTPDSDLVEELARGRLMDGAPNQVAVPRSIH